jgi:hypothetical protein
VRAGWDIGKVLQRYLFTLTTHIEKLQYQLTNYRVLFPLHSQIIAFVKLWRYSCPPDPRRIIPDLRGEKGIFNFRVNIIFLYFQLISALNLTLYYVELTTDPESYMVQGYPILASSSLPFHLLFNTFLNAVWEG